MTKSNPFSLDNKTILITGASSGIGRSISILCSKMGAKVILIGRNESRLKETASYINEDNYIYYTFDLNNIENIKKLVSRIISENGMIDGLVNAAGIESTVPLKVLSVSHLEEIFKINVFAAVELTKHLTKKKNFESNGSIVFLSSVMGSLGQKGKVAYCGSKAAIKNMVKPLSLELAQKKLRVNSISPGIVNTEMTQKLFDTLPIEGVNEIKKLHPLGFGEAEDIANLCVFLLSDGSRWITGTDITIDGGYSVS